MPRFTISILALEGTALFDDNLRPVPQKNVDYKSLPLAPTPEEYFLLSRIDGNVTVASLCSISGLSRDATMKALSRLQQAGLITMPGSFGEVSLDGSAPPSPPPQARSKSVIPATQASESATSATPASSSQASEYSLWPVAPEAFDYPADVLAENVELEEAERRDIVYRHAHVDQLDYYTFIGVTRDAKRKDIRDAYFTLSKKYHPDLFFEKELGSYRGRVEAIFQVLNKANQILSHKKKRQEYDASLPTQGAASPSVGGQERVAHASPSPSMVRPGASAPVDARQQEVTFAALLKRAEKYESAGRYADAAAEYQKAFEVKADAAVALRGANLLMRSGEEHLQGAIDLARLAANHEPGNSKPLLLLGDAYEELGNYEQAKQHYLRAQRIDPESKIIARRLKYLEVASR